jgi:short-subunit dehydrogenase
MNILVTGASSGIGYEIVKSLAKDKRNLVFALSRNAALLNSLKSECIINYADCQIELIPYDLKKTSKYHLICKQISEKVNSLDLLINNAGFLVNKPFENITYQEMEESFLVNAIAPFLLSQAVLPLLQKGNRPQILNIGSMGGVNGTVKFSGLAAYSSSKGALSILSECLAEELKEDHIRVNCLALGAINTEMLRSAFPGFKAAHEPAEIAEFITEFAYNTSVFFNGKTIQVSSTTP